MIPEMNLQDIAGSDPEFLLNMLKYRATLPLWDQYVFGVDGAPGDRDFILDSIRATGLHHAKSFPYGYSKKMNQSRYADNMVNLQAAVRAGFCLPRSSGELVLQRQLYTIRALNVLIEDILDLGSTTRVTTKASKKPAEAATSALEKLSIAPKQGQVSPQGVFYSAMDQKSALEGYLDLMRTEPAFLAFEVNRWFFSRAEQVPDELGRILPLHTDKYITIAFCEVIHNAIIGTATWDYICRLMQGLMDHPKDKVYQGIVLQELANVCNFEYRRVQRLFKRYLSTRHGAKHFRRVNKVYDNGLMRVTMKTKPQDIEREDPQLSWMLRLCQNETDVRKAATWIKKIDELHRSQPATRENMDEKEFELYGDLAVTANFVQHLSAAFTLPSVTPKKGQLYIAKEMELFTKLDALKHEIDLAKYVIPFDNLKEPYMADDALTTLDHFIREMTGLSAASQFESLIEDSISAVEDEYQRQKAEVAKTETSAVTTPAPEPTTVEDKRRQHKEKEKTRTTQTSIYTIYPPEPPGEEDLVPSGPVFKVRPSTLRTFTSLFDKSSSQGRSSITWNDFQAAMVDLKFSVVPKFGSVYTFEPAKGGEDTETRPERGTKEGETDGELKRSITLHRPHGSRIEGHKLLLIAGRLRRVYGWVVGSFET
jgi:hypothetical protein